MILFAGQSENRNYKPTKSAFKRNDYNTTLVIMMTKRKFR